MNNIFYGLHNAMTAYRPTNLLGKIFNFFSKCQDNIGVLRNDVICYDLQIAYKDGKWLGSHGLAWYDIEIHQFLNELIKYKFNNKVNSKLYLRILYDNHWGVKRYDDLFADMVNDIKEKYNNYFNVYQVINEKNFIFLYNDATVKVYERYWTLNWAKEQVKKDWKKFYLLLPLPKIWNKIYEKQWEQEFLQNTYSNIWMKDFI